MDWGVREEGTGLDGWGNGVWERGGDRVGLMVVWGEGEKRGQGRLERGVG